MRFVILVFTLAALSSPAWARSKTRGPKVVADLPSVNSCADGDPYGPCRGRVIKVRNSHPRRRYYVRVGCGVPHLQTVAIIPPRRTAVFTLLWGGPGSLLKGQCRIENTVHFTGRRLPGLTIRVKRAAR